MRSLMQTQGGPTDRNTMRPLLINPYAVQSAGGGGGGGLTITNRDSGTGTSQYSDTATISPASGSMLLLSVAVACDGGPTSGGVVPTGVAGTWTLIHSQVYAARRRHWLFVGTGTMTSEVIQIDYTGSYTFQEKMWSVEEVTGADTITQGNYNVTSGATSLATLDVGTPAAGDIIFSTFALEDGAQSPVYDQVTGVLALEEGGANVRTLLTGYDAEATLDETPRITWTGTCGGSAIGVIVPLA